VSVDSGVCVLGGGIRVPHDASDHRRRRRGKAEDSSRAAPPPPHLSWLPLYKRAQLRPDIVAGVVVAVLAIPQSLGYVSIAGARSGFRAQLGEDHLWHGLSQTVRVARRKHGIERPGHAEPKPMVVEVEEAKDEVVASPTLDDAAESEASRPAR
jgi:hypothetical protein